MKTGAMRNQTDRSVTFRGAFHTVHTHDIAASLINPDERNHRMGQNCDQDSPWQIWPQGIIGIALQEWTAQMTLAPDITERLACQLNPACHFPFS